MAKKFKDIRPKAHDRPEQEEKIKVAGIDAPLPSDDEELDDADENTRNADGSAEDMVTKAIKPLYKKRKDGSYSAESVIHGNQELVENVLDNLKKIVTKSQAGAIKFKDGSSSKVDLVTASALLSVYGALNKNNQVKMAQQLAKDKSSFTKMSNFAFKQGRINSKMGLQGPSPGPIRMV